MISNPAKKSICREMGYWLDTKYMESSETYVANTLSAIQTELMSDASCRLIAEMVTILGLRRLELSALGTRQFCALTRLLVAPAPSIYCGNKSLMSALLIAC